MSPRAVKLRRVSDVDSKLNSSKDRHALSSSFCAHDAASILFCLSVLLSLPDESEIFSEIKQPRFLVRKRLGILMVPNWTSAQTDALIMYPHLFHSCGFTKLYVIPVHTYSSYSLCVR